MRTLRSVAVLVAVMFLFACAGQQNIYSTNMAIEKQVKRLADKYELWYQAAPPEVQGEWKKDIDPVFIRIDELLDVYHDLVAEDLGTETVLREIDKLITIIMIKMAEKEANNG